MKCEYEGCVNEAKFTTKGGKHICCESPNQCPINRAKNSNKLKDAYRLNTKLNVFADATIGALGRAKSIEKKQTDQLERFLTGQSNTLANHAIKKLLIRESIVEDKCAICNISEWQNKKLNLQLDHIDGDSFNNVQSNLRLLCPNCHSLTDTYCGRNKNTGKQKITDEILLEALKKESNIRQALISVGLAPKGGNYSRAVKLMNKHQI
jgi:Zn finger protein HypA/HybF involved in hydrogenase expression